MTEAAVSFAGNLTEDPEVRYSNGGVARAMFRVAVSGPSSPHNAVVPFRTYRVPKGACLVTVARGKGPTTQRLGIAGGARQVPSCPARA